MIDYTIHVEPFIKIPVQESHFKRTIYTCGTFDHFKHGKSKYCDECGKERFDKEVDASYIKNIQELIGDESFIDYIEGEVMYLFSNFRNAYAIETKVNILTTICDVLIQKQIASFKFLHKKDIALLEKAIKHPVKVEFGFVYIAD